MTAIPDATPDNIASTIAQVWNDVLGMPPVDQRQDFFAAGGDSLGFIGLIEGIEAALGVVLPTDALVLDSMGDGISPAALAAAARSAGAGDVGACSAHDPGLSLVPLHLGGRGPMLHVFPGLGAHAVTLQALALALGEDVRLCVFHRDLDDTPGGTLEDLAARAIRLLRATQPHGPYALGGFSFGAIIAYEMARQLLAAGESVQPLVILDAACPLWRLTPVNVLPVGWRLLRTLVDGRRPLPPVVRVARVLGGRELEHLPRQALVAEHDRLARAYLRRVRRLSRPAVPVWLYRGSDHPRSRPDPGPMMGWDLLAGPGPRLRVLPGRHLDMLKGPGAVALAQDLAEAFGTATTAPPAPLRQER